MRAFIKLPQVVLSPLLVSGRWISEQARRLGYWFSATDRRCKEAGCTKPLFFWQNGKYCSFHSRSHRVHTVIVVVKEPQQRT